MIYSEKQIAKTFHTGNALQQVWLNNQIPVIGLTELEMKGYNIGWELPGYGVTISREGVVLVGVGYELAWYSDRYYNKNKGLK